MSLYPPVLRRLTPLLAALAVVTGAVACATAPDAKTAPSTESAAASRPAEPTPPAEEADPAPPAEPAERDEANAAADAPRTMAEALNTEYARAEAGVPAEIRSLEALEPPDGSWLSDDEGRLYFTAELPKQPYYRKVGGDRVRGPRGVVFHLAGETEEAYLVKIYKVEPTAPKADSGPTPEEIAAVEAGYRVEWPTADRVTFTDWGTGLPGQGQWRNGFELADMNGDGHLDLVHGSPRRSPGPPSIFLGDGAGSWRLWEAARFPSAPYDYGDTAVADFDGDGRLDLALGIHLSGLLALVQEAPGRFVRWSEGLPLGRPGEGDQSRLSSRAVTTADWNGDGRPDLLALSEGPRHPKATEREITEIPRGLAVYLNQGDGSWALAPGPEDDRVFGDAVALADLDLDGRLDVVTGTGGQGHRRLVHLAGGGERSLVPVMSLRPAAFAWAVAAADFDGDGRDDLAVSYTSRELGEWRSGVDLHLTRLEADGLVWERRSVAFAERDADLPTALAAGDVDGDGRADLATATDDGRVLIYLGQGDGSFVVEEAPELGTGRAGCRGYHLLLEDLDGDGRDDIAAGFAGDRCPGGGSLRVWKSSAR